MYRVLHVLLMLRHFIVILGTIKALICLAYIYYPTITLLDEIHLVIQDE